MNDAIADALHFAAFRHRNQRRLSGERVPYINHPIDLLAILRLEGGIDDAAVLCAALLHDTIEDTDTTADEIAARFGDAVCGLVLEMTDDKTLPKQTRKDLQVAHAPHASPQAKLVKLADKIANVRDLGRCPPENWSLARRIAYMDWAEQVVAGLRGTHAGLEALFDAALTEARHGFAGR